MYVAYVSQTLFTADQEGNHPKHPGTDGKSHPLVLPPSGVVCCGSKAANRGAGERRRGNISEAAPPLRRQTLYRMSRRDVNIHGPTRFAVDLGLAHALSSGEHVVSRGPLTNGYTFW